MSTTCADVVGAASRRDPRVAHPVAIAASTPGEYDICHKHGMCGPSPTPAPSAGLSFYIVDAVYTILCVCAPMYVSVSVCVSALCVHACTHMCICVCVLTHMEVCGRDTHGPVAHLGPTSLARPQLSPNRCTVLQVKDPVPDDLVMVGVSHKLWAEVGTNTRKSVKGVLRNSYMPAEGTSSLLVAARKLLGRLESKNAGQVLSDGTLLDEAQDIVRRVAGMVAQAAVASPLGPAHTEEQELPPCLQSSVLDQVRGSHSDLTTRP